MLRLAKSFLKEEEGMGVVEITLIIAALVAIALLFKDKITAFVTKALDNIFNGLDSETTH